MVFTIIDQSSHGEVFEKLIDRPNMYRYLLSIDNLLSIILPRYLSNLQGYSFYFFSKTICIGDYATYDKQKQIR